MEKVALLMLVQGSYGLLTNEDNISRLMVCPMKNEKIIAGSDVMNYDG